MVNGEAKSSSSPPVVSITNPSIDISSPSNNQSSGGKQVSLVTNFVYFHFDEIFELCLFILGWPNEDICADNTKEERGT